MANSISIADDGAQSVKSDEYMLAQYQTALLDLTQNGKSYTIVGSRTFQAADVGFIQEMMTFYESRILRKKGGTTRNQINWAGGDSARNDDLGRS